MRPRPRPDQPDQDQAKITRPRSRPKPERCCTTPQRVYACRIRQCDKLQQVVKFKLCESDN